MRVAICVAPCGCLEMASVASLNLKANMNKISVPLCGDGHNCNPG